MALPWVAILANLAKGAMDNQAKASAGMVNAAQGGQALPNTTNPSQPSGASNLISMLQKSIGDKQRAKTTSAPQTQNIPNVDLSKIKDQYMTNWKG